MEFRLFVAFIFLLGATDGSVVSPSCGSEWTISGGTYCYRFSHVRMNWTNADKECRKLDSTLLRVFDQNTYNDLKPIISGVSDTRWWTGLNDLKSSGVWEWDHGAYSVDVDYAVINWLKEPDDTNHGQNCGALNIQGSISDERCGDKHRYVCEYTPPTGTPCIESWVSFKTGCYYFPAGDRDPWSKITWTMAREKCATILRGTLAAAQTCHLLYIDDQDELNYVSNQLPKLTLTPDIWWIGLSDIQSEGNFVWGDGSKLNQVLAIWSWEPNNLGAQERCGAINRNSSFGDLSCAAQESYICMKENDAAGASNLPSLGCPVSWTRAGHSCYFVELQNLQTWTGAKSACGQLGARLLQVNTLDKEVWIGNQNYIFNNGGWFWTGLNYHSDKKWYWSDGSVANISLVNWNKEPNDYKGREDCATIDKKGQFNDVSCLNQGGFICEMNLEDSVCPLGWLTYPDDMQLNCYYISNTTATNDEAKSQCKQLTYPRDSYLVAFTTQPQLTFVSKKVALQKSNVTVWYTGLTDKGHEGFWIYDTGFGNTPPQIQPGLIPWNVMPKFVKGDENCVTIGFAGQYINKRCTTMSPYICERPAYGTYTNAGSKAFLSKFAVSSVFILACYFVVYGICLHYILHLTYVLSPTVA